jgi:Thioredoxin
MGHAPSRTGPGFEGLTPAVVPMGSSAVSARRESCRMAGDATAVGTFGAVLVRIGIAAVLIAAAIAVAFVLQRRRPVAPPRDVYPVPRQLDRQDFRRAETPWLVALFSSTTCESCDGLMAKVAALESADVAICEIEYHAQPDVHGRYEIAGIPTTVVADGDGVVRAAFVGAFTATDLWAAVAEARAPGSTPEPELGELT